MAIIKQGKEQGQGSADKDYDNIEAGEHDARLVYVANLGMHPNEYRGEKKADVQKLALGVEIVDSSVTIEGKEEPRLLWVNPINVYYSLTEKGKELLMYKIFNPSAKEGEEADWDSVLGSPCAVTIANIKGKGENSDKVYDNITNVVAIPKKYQKDVSPARITDMSTAGEENMEAGAMKALFGLAKWQFDQRLGEEEDSPEPTPKKAAVNNPHDDYEDDIPFS